FTEQLRVVERDGVITGYAGAWRNIETLVIGPVIAADLADAQALIADLAARAPGARLRLDVDQRHASLHASLEGQGVARAFGTTLMVHGARGLPGDRDRLFLPVMQALGYPSARRRGPVRARGPVPPGRVISNPPKVES